MMSLARRFLIVATVVLAPGMTASGQYRLSGHVRDAETGEALAGANVRLESGAVTRGVAASLDGSFAFANLRPAVYEIVVSYVGYASHRQSLTWSAEADEYVVILMTASAFDVNPITVTASRAPQKLLDAPAAVTVLEPEEIEARTALTAAEHLKSIPSVDIISTGINQSRIVVRGFNDNLASSLLTLVDNRIARLPSIRLTALQLIPISNADIERIEVVSGPASALYGPNSANGVVHIITRSPFDAPGTTATVSLGENDIMSAAIRRAGTITPRLGYKLYVQYYRGSDFEFSDSTEVAARQAAISAGADPDTLKIGLRDLNVRNLSVQGRLDYKFAERGLVSVNTGFTRGDNIEASPTGAVQAKGAIVTYVQGLVRYRNLFGQVFYNLLDSRDSYALRTGDLFRENSSLFVAQLQHAHTLSDWQRVTYGADLFLTRPDSKGSVNGQYEERDDINEVGAYVQSETSLSPSWDLVTAARVDRHNRIDELTFSPRAAVVFKPRPGHTLRATYNRAFQTPATNHMFADVIGQRDVFQGGQLQPLLGFSPTIDLRAQGTPSNGFRFRRGPLGETYFRSPYARLDQRGLTESDYIQVGDPEFTNVMWSVARAASVAGLASGLAESGYIAPDRTDDVSQALDQVLPQSVEGVTNALRILDLGRQEFVPSFFPNDVAALKITRTETFEFGYKGIVANRLAVGFSVYRSRVKNFIGPFVVATPNVFLDPATLQLFLSRHLQTSFSNPDNADALSLLMPLDKIAGLGNNDGSPANELAFILSTGVAGSVPFGTVSPEEAFDPTAVILARRNFGDISLWGADMDFSYTISRKWTVGGGYSYLSDNLFRDVDGVDDVALNAPRHKAGASVRFSAHDRELSTELRTRYVGGFPVRSDVYVGEVKSYVTFDLSFHYRVPFSLSTQLTVTVQNILDNEHQEFVDVPKIGRLAMLRLTHRF